VRERRNLGRTDLEEAQDKCLQYDVIQWLCVRDQTYSQVGFSVLHFLLELKAFVVQHVDEFRVLPWFIGHVICY